MERSVGRAVSGRSAAATRGLLWDVLGAGQSHQLAQRRGKRNPGNLMRSPWSLGAPGVARRSRACYTPPHECCTGRAHRRVRGQGSRAARREGAGDARAVGRRQHRPLRGPLPQGGHWRPRRGADPGRGGARRVPAGAGEAPADGAGFVGRARPPRRGAAGAHPGLRQPDRAGGSLPTLPAQAPHPGLDRSRAGPAALGQPHHGAAVARGSLPGGAALRRR